MNTKKRFFTYFLFVCGLIFIDQITKYIAILNLGTDSYVVNQLLTLHIVLNRGIAWGMFNFADTLPFLAITVGIILLTVFVAFSALIGFLNGRSIFGEALIVAGSISNLFDRFLHHAVVDFVQLSYKNWSWPVFNFADCCIVFGVIFILFQQYRNR